MIEHPSCTNCGRQIRYAQPPTAQELRSGKRFTCRDCRREPVPVELGIRQVMRRIGRKPAELEAM